MNALVQHLPAVTIEPVMSADLAYRVGQLLNPRDAVGIPDRYPVTLRKEASGLVQEYRHLTRPPTRELIAAWMAPIVAAVSNPPSDADDLRARISVVCEVSGDLPAAVWTSATRSLGIRQWKFFPSASEIDALLRPLADEIVRKRDALQAIASAPDITERPREPRSEPRTPEAIAAVAATLSVYRAEVAARTPIAQPIPVEPRYLSANDLATVYREQAKVPGALGGLARMRLGMLGA